MRICRSVAWEVDAALRPEGRDGPLVRTLASHEAYYRRWASTWEFQALLKARPAAGDLDLGRRYPTVIAPMVWAAAERPDFVADVRAMRRRTIANLPSGVAPPRAQARLGWPARRRVRDPAAAARPRSRRRVAAGRRHAAGPGRAACRRLRRRRRCGQPGRRLPVPARGRAPPAAAPDAPHPPRARGRRRASPPSPAAWAFARTHAAARPRCSRPSGPCTPARSAGCTRSCSTGRCSRRSRASRPRRCD